uniref:Uncharacterized protein n=1 Tax=Knipowitschia caucasica TaxID=637954 RepID=A0AAV2KPD2_KNICA
MRRVGNEPAGSEAAADQPQRSQRAKTSDCFPPRPPSSASRRANPGHSHSPAEEHVSRGAKANIYPELNCANTDSGHTICTVFCSVALLSFHWLPVHPEPPFPTSGTQVYQSACAPVKLKTHKTRRCQI